MGLPGILGPCHDPSNHLEEFHRKVHSTETKPAITVGKKSSSIRSRSCEQGWDSLNQMLIFFVSGQVGIWIESSLDGYGQFAEDNYHTSSHSLGLRPGSQTCA